MVFHSYAFILIFLPITFALFVVTQRAFGWGAAYAFLGIASLVFYAQWSMMLLGILLVSVVFNFTLGRTLINAPSGSTAARLQLAGGIVANIAMLAYFKYTNFFIDIINQVSGQGIHHLSIVLPVGISFYTFIQIGYLIEAYSGRVAQPSFAKYTAFATFFPCVTAGPLVLQREIFGQMEAPAKSGIDMRLVAAGVTMFSIGLFKKVVFADSIAPYANSVFNGVAAGQGVETSVAWIGALAYSLQLYFDFSGYSDMALGLGAIFALKLPLNFNSPFKAHSISDFWQRWHMTMTRFFTTYVFSLLSMNGMRRAMALKYGPFRRFMSSGAFPIILTMLVAGIWHGSGWVFVIYGLLHGIAIAINNGWKHFKMPEIPRPLGWLMTMLVVVTGLVIFRAPDVSTAFTILAAMWGLPSVGAAELGLVTVSFAEALPLILALTAIVLAAPNAQEIMSSEWISTSPRPETGSGSMGLLAWRPVLGWSVATATVFVIALATIGNGSTFLYYQF